MKNDMHDHIFFKDYKLQMFGILRGRNLSIWLQIA